MLVAILLTIPLTIIQGLLDWLPVVTKLPSVGSISIDTLLVQAMGYIRFLATVFPPIGSILIGVAWVIGFKLTLKIIAMIPIVRGLLYK